MRIKMLALILIGSFFTVSLGAHSSKVWSILICTLEERSDTFEKIYSKLRKQIEDAHLEEKVEILFFKDNREHSIGFKRNALIQKSQAEYVCFVDDDDDVHEQYVSLIYEQLLKKPDCVSLVGIMTTCGQHPELFIHSIRYNDKYCTDYGVHFRPPNHLNPIKRSVVSKIAFPDSNFGEDRDWALDLAQSGVLKNEATLLTPYYFYLYDGKYNGQASSSLASTTEKKEETPLVSIITSVYKADEFISSFLENIVKDPFFNKCELIIINANSPGNEEPIILEYVEKYPAIKYERLAIDPGLYAVWNYAIGKARAPYITNLNVDDRRLKGSLENDYNYLQHNPGIDLVYSDVYCSFSANETEETINPAAIVMKPFEFSVDHMSYCLPGPMPMWRKSLHDRCGFFDITYLSAGDFEFWNRVVSRGALFKKMKGISGIYYVNPKGLSTDTDHAKEALRKKENDRIIQEYSVLWGW